MLEPAVPDAQPAAVTPAPPLGRLAARVFALSFALTIFSKLIAVAAQVILARLLFPGDYGVFGLAVALAIIPNVIRDAGISPVLVQRRHDFDRLINGAFWLSMTLGVGSAGLIVLFAAAGAEVYQSPQLLTLGLILALASPFMAAGNLPGAKMQIELRLRLLTLLETGLLLTLTGLTIIFAWAGLGPVSLALPILVAAVVRAVVYWTLAPLKLNWRPDTHLWHVFGIESSLLIATTICWAVTSQGANVILALFASDGLVGFYVFAIGASMQAASLLAGSVAGILFPTLSRLNGEPARQRAAFLTACGSSAAITVPFALLPAACAPQLIELLFPPKWGPAAPLLQILSVAAALMTIGYPTNSFLVAQNRNRVAFRFAAVMAVYFVISVTVLTAIFGSVTQFSPTGTAIAVAQFYLVSALTSLYIVLAPGGSPWKPMYAIAVRPLLLGGVAVGVSAVLTWALDHYVDSNLLLILFSLAMMLAVYVPLLGWAAPDVLRNLIERALSMAGSRFGRFRAAGSDGT